MSEGLKSQFFLKCDICHYACSIWFEPSTDYVLDLNEAAVAATIPIGSGFYQLEQLLACVNIFSMANNTHNKYREKVIETF